MLFAQEALQMSKDSFGVLHRLERKHYENVINKSIHGKRSTSLLGTGTFEFSQDCTQSVSVCTVTPHLKDQRNHTIPSALSPKSLSFSLRHTAMGVFLLDSLRKQKC